MFILLITCILLIKIIISFTKFKELFHFHKNIMKKRIENYADIPSHYIKKNTYEFPYYIDHETINVCEFCKIKKCGGYTCSECDEYCQKLYKPTTTSLGPTTTSLGHTSNSLVPTTTTTLAPTTTTTLAPTTTTTLAPTTTTTLAPIGN